MSSVKNDGFESDDDEEEELDPRVKLELEKLNVAADGVNHLETEFGEAQTLFHQMRADAGAQLQLLKGKLGKSVERARPYYETLRKARQAKAALHHAAVEFENAQSRHDLSRKKVAEAESRAFAGDGKINCAMQDMLNQANVEVMEAAKNKTECWKAHQLTAQIFEEQQKKLNELNRTLSKVISNSRPYFDLKMNLNKQLEEQKYRIENIQAGVKVAKKEYANTLLKLEKISNEIHHMRRMRKLNQKFLTPRECGVGAESASEDESTNNIHVKTDVTSFNGEDFDQVSAFGDDNESVTGSELESDNHNSPSDITGDHVFDFNEDLEYDKKKMQLGSQGYDLISSKEIQVIPPAQDFLGDEFLFKRDGKLCLNLIKRWKSLNSLEEEKYNEGKKGDAVAVRRSSHSFILLPGLQGVCQKTKEVEENSQDPLYAYDIIDGKKTRLDNNGNRKLFTSCEQRHPGEGCDFTQATHTAEQDQNAVASSALA